MLVVAGYIETRGEALVAGDGIRDMSTPSPLAGLR